MRGGDVILRGRTDGSFWPKFAVVLGSLALSTAIRLLLDPFLHGTSPLLLYFLAVALCSWYGGLIPGLTATVLGILLGDWFFHVPRGHFSIFHSSDNIVRTLLFFLIGAAFSILAEQFHRERRRNLAAMREAQLREERLRIFAAVIEGTNDFVGVSTPEGKPIYVNEAGRKMVGLAEADVPSTNVIDYFWPEDRERISQEAIPAMKEAGRWSGEARFRNFATGAPIHTMWNAFVVRDSEGNPLAWATISPDLGAMKRIESALRDSEERFRFLVDAIPNIVWTADANGRQNFANSRWYEFTGIDPNDNDPEIWRRICHPDDLQLTADAWHHALSTGSQYNCIHRIRRADGEYRSILSRALPQRDDNGRIVRWVGTGTDLTDIRRTDEALRLAISESERNRAQLEAVFQAVGDGIVVFDNSGDFLLVNEAEARMFGYSNPQEMRLNVSEFRKVFEIQLLDGTPLPLESWPVARIMRGEIISNLELKIRFRHTGRELYLNLSGAPVRDNGGNQVLGVIITRDVTDSKIAQQALIRTEKLASMGRLAATVAHEINNPLEAVMNSVFIAANDPAVPEQSRHYLSVAQEELIRVAHITRQTLGFYRETGAPGKIEIPDIVDGLLDIFAPRLALRSVKVQREYRASAPVFANSGEIRQIISNLLSNAIDALNSTGGVVHVRTCNTSLPDGTPAVRFTLADTGTGIDPAVRGRIFEPFVTTKETVGTGLGLWVSKGLIEKHGGRIRVRSRVGRGTVFSIVLPAARETEDSAFFSRSASPESAA